MAPPRKNVDICWDDYFVYDPSSSTFLRWAVTLLNSDGKRNNRAQVGKVAGTETNGRTQVTLRGKIYKTSRIIWEMLIGKLEDGEIVDHIDGDSMNNGIQNLRKADFKINRRNSKMFKNNTSGVTGVSRKSVQKLHYKRYEYWVAGWCDNEGAYHEKSFSINKLGEEVAFNLACKYREVIMKSLNDSGAGYTERHGKIGGK